MRHRWIAVFALLALWVGGHAQRGRHFVSIEAHVGTARFVHVGVVKDIQPIEHNLPKDGFYPGKAHRVVFAVSETIKGDPAKSIDLILVLQHNHDLEYLRDNKIEVMLAASTEYVDEEAEVGLLDPSAAYPGLRQADNPPHYPPDRILVAFRILQPIRHPAKKPETEWIAKQLNVSLNEGRMFDLGLKIVSRRDEILKRARAFAKKHPEVLHAHHINVPNEFGVNCGYTNAYCGITLPLCPESRALALELQQDPSRLLRDVKKEDRDGQRKSIGDSLRLFLSQFPSGKLSDDRLPL